MTKTNTIQATLPADLADRIWSPGDKGYAEALGIWPKSDVMPKLVIRCRSTADVQHAVRLARDKDLPLSVRAGGHDWEGRALCEGVVIDLTGMRDVAILPEGEVAQIGGGARGADLLAHTDPRGLCAVTGAVSLVGMGGLILGGGYGPLLPQFGLASDNLIGAEVVLADGSVVHTSAPDHDDLLWALRGGGGNFGVVTSMHVRLYRIPQVRAGMIAFPLGQAMQVFNGVTEIVESAPDALAVSVGIIPSPQGGQLAAVVPTWSGDPREGEAWIASLMKLGTPVMSHVAESPFGASRALFDQRVINGLRTFMRTRSVRYFHGDVAHAALAQMAKAPSPLCALLTHEFRGAAARIASSASAFGTREPHVMVLLQAQVPEGGGDGEAERAWIDETAAALDAFALPGGYANILSSQDHDRERIAQSFGANADRLRAAKRRYDPDGTFHSALALPRDYSLK